MNSTKLKFISRAFFTLISVTLFGFLIFERVAPFGGYIAVSTEGSPQQAITLTPSNRLTQIQHSDGTIISKIHNDIVYFSTETPSLFETSKIKVMFLNNTDNQDLYVGFQDQESYHYYTKLIDSPILNNLSWGFTDNNPRLYQRNHTYNSYQNFLANPSKDAAIGFHDFDPNILKQAYIPEYSPASFETIIDTPMRGKLIFYVYVDNEPFKMWVSKQDLNWYEDPDPVNIKIYKDKDVVYSATIDDDGVFDSSRKVLPPMETYIQNPGPELPEPGVYKVVIDGGGDSIIKSIKTNLHKIVFDSPLQLASNSEVYPEIIEKTVENKLYSDALVLSAQTFHNQGLQDIKIGDSILKLTEVKKEESTASAQPITEITVPKSDVVLKGLLGHFAFSKDQFFSPPLPAMRVCN